MTTIVYIHEPFYVPKVCCARDLGGGSISLHGNFSAEPPLWRWQKREFAQDHDAGRAYLAAYCNILAHTQVPTEVTRIDIELPDSEEAQL